MKTKIQKILQLTPVVLIALFMVSCQTSLQFGTIKGNGNLKKETRTVTESFEKIEVNSGIELVVTQSDNVAISVEIDENILPLITTTVENGVLIISSKESYTSSHDTKVNVSLPLISGLRSQSGASIKSANTLKSTSLIVDSSSGSEIEIDVEADYLSLESSSGSEIEVTGKALKVETSSSSGSEIDASKLLANEIFSQSSSGSETKVNPILSLNAKATSGSEIKYKNVPKKLEKTENSGGSISNF